MTEQNEYTVVVYRHIRPDQYVWDEDYDVLTHDNMYGITVRFDIDFNTGMVTAGWTICHGVNFSKEVGRYLADHAYVKETFSLSDVDIFGGLVDALIFNLNCKYPKYSCISKDSTFMEKLKLFKRALREN